MSKAAAAVTAVIRRIQDDPRVAYYLAPGTRTYEVLTEAAAEAEGVEVAAYRRDLETSLKFEAPPKCRDCGKVGLLEEMQDLLERGQVKFVGDAGGGIWTWPDRAEAAVSSQ